MNRMNKSKLFYVMIYIYDNNKNRKNEKYTYDFFKRTHLKIHADLAIRVRVGIIQNSHTTNRQPTILIYIKMRRCRDNTTRDMIDDRIL